MNPGNDQDVPVSPSRRAFLHACIGGMSAAGAGIVAYPVVSFVVSLPERIGGATTIELPLETLSEDQAHYFDRDGIQIVIVYTNKEPKVFDAGCTHLGCIVVWDPNDHVFRCPCHGAIFDDRGQVVSGPVNTPLRTVKFEIKDQKIVIT